MPIRYLSGLSVDSTVLVVDAANDRVGIGTASPTTKLHIEDTTGNPQLVIGDGASVYSSFQSANSLYINAGQGGGGSDTIFRRGTGLTESMRITSTGNVGIGTTSPAGKLHIRGSAASITPSSVGNLLVLEDTENGISILSSTAGAGYLIFGDTADNDVGQIIYDHSANSMNFWANAAERMRITAAGNVGIGTSSPTQQLETTARFVIGNSVTGRVGIFGQATATADTYITIQNTAGNFDVGTSANGHYFYGIGALPLQFFTNSTERARFTAGGNLLIGTTTDSGYKLDVNGTGRFSGSITSNASGVGTLLLGSTSGSSQIAGRITATESPSYNATGKIGFSVTTWGVGTDYGLTEVMAIDMRGSDSKAPTIWMNPFGGNVGIGTTSPVNCALAINQDWVSGSATVKAYPKTTMASGGLAGFGVFDSDGTTRVAYMTGTASNMELWAQSNIPMNFGTNDTQRMRITAGGNVLIGTTTDAGFKLDVNGTGRFTSRLTVNATSGGNGIDIVGRTDGFGFLSFKNNANNAINAEIGVSDAQNLLFYIGSTVRLTLGSTGTLNLSAYGSGSKTGTVAYNLAVDASGNVIETPGGVVDGSGTANYVTKWQDANTVTNSSITDDGSTVTALVNRVAMNQQAGIYVFPKSVGASASAGIFEIKNTHGAQALRVSFVCSTSGYSVAKTYEVVHCFAQTPIYSKVVDTGPFSGEDFNVVFTNNGDNTGLIATITNNSTSLTANIVATIFLGGSSTTITITAL